MSEANHESSLDSAGGFSAERHKRSPTLQSRTASGLGSFLKERRLPLCLERLFPGHS